MAHCLSISIVISPLICSPIERPPPWPPGSKLILALKSLDRSTEYQRGVTEGAPHAVQVADRFHLLVNLREALERLLDRNRVHLRGFVLPLTRDGAVPATAQRKPGRRSPVEEAARQAHITVRQERHSQIQTLHEQGLDIKTIARQLQLSRGTVYRSLRLDEHSASQRSNPIRSKLDPYLPYLYRRWQDGCHNGLLMKDHLGKVKSWKLPLRDQL